jgi:hypothetical protein
MVSTFNAHIFKQRSVGEREEVKLKIFGPDGQPLDLSNLGGDSGDSGPPPSSWVQAGPSMEEGPLAAGARFLGPQLAFEAGPHGLVLVHASIQAWHPPSQFQVDLILDGGTPNEEILTSIPINQSAPTMISVNEQGLFTNLGERLSSPGVMLLLSTGAHTVQFHTTGVNAGGFYQRAVLAAMALG